MSEAQDMAFEPLPLRRRQLAPFKPNQYRVAGRSGEVREIEATTAYDAFRQSGFSDALKIERMSSLDHAILSRKEFADEMAFDLKGAFADVTPQGPADIDALLKSKNPILSADSLDALMRALQEKAAKKPAPEPAPVAESAPPATPEATAAETAPVPAPAPTAAALTEGAVPGPTGLDVHGDGFDEIIPSTPAPKPAAPAKPAAAADAAKPAEPAADAPPAPPAKELTEADVERLLGGK